MKKQATEHPAILSYKKRAAARERASVMLALEQIDGKPLSAQSRARLAELRLQNPRVFS